MKKTFSSILVLMMMLSMLSTALAVPFTLEDMGITIDVPEGMTAVDASTEDAVVIDIAVNDNENLHYAFIMGFIEGYEGKSLGGLSEEEVQALVESAASSIDLEEALYGVEELDGASVLIIENAETTLGYFLLLEDGWALSLAMGKTDGVSLTDEEIEIGMNLLFSIEFTDVGEE